MMNVLNISQVIPHFLGSSQEYYSVLSNNKVQISVGSDNLPGKLTEKNGWRNTYRNVRTDEESHRAVCCFSYVIMGALPPKGTATCDTGRGESYSHSGQQTEYLNKKLLHVFNKFYDI